MERVVRMEVHHQDLREAALVIAYRVMKVLIVRKQCLVRVDMRTNLVRMVGLLQVLLETAPVRVHLVLLGSIVKSQLFVLLVQEI